MPNDPKAPVPTSSIVMKAIDATTFTELQEFTKDLESRPTDRLLHDIADLVRPSESKAQIVGYVIATKYRHADPNERRHIVDHLNATAKVLPPGEQRDRLRVVIDRLRHEG
jgi:hypothetical protein